MCYTHFVLDQQKYNKSTEMRQLQVFRLALKLSNRTVTISGFNAYGWFTIIVISIYPLQT